MLRLQVFACAVLCASALPTGVQRENRNFSVNETISNIINQGYRAEAHHVITDDGYILEMHRIPYKRYEQQGDENRPVVLVMHGLYSASNAFIFLGPEYSMGYNLADAGFDVWMGNARGNRNSRRHVTLDPDDDLDRLQFFNFSWEEIGMIDIATMVDYIINETGKERLHYIGHSQGGSVFLVLNSMRVEYNEKFASAHLLAGVGYMNHFPNEELKALAVSTDIIYNMAVATGNVEMYPPNQPEAAHKTMGGEKSDYCFGGLEHKSFCDAVGIKEIIKNGIEREDGSSSNSLETGGGSLKQMAHYGQNVRDMQFRRWNYGSAGNVAEYGSSDPPNYDISLITVNVTMHYTVNDDLLDERDVLAMANDMPNTVARRVARESFLHGDFAAALDAKELVTDYVIEAIQYVEEHGTADVTEDRNEPDPEDIAEAVAGSASSLAFGAFLQLTLFVSFIINVM